MNMSPLGQIGSHLGNMGPFWQIRVPLGILRVPIDEVTGPPAAITGPIRRTVRMGIYAEGAIESEPLPLAHLAGSPLPP